MPAVTAAKTQEAAREDAAFEKGVELVLDELRQIGAGGGCGLGDEGRGVLLHQAVQGGLLGAVARSGPGRDRAPGGAAAP